MYQNFNLLTRVDVVTAGPRISQFQYIGITYPTVYNEYEMKKLFSAIKILWQFYLRQLQ
jgi:hypothetical protein